MRRILPLGTDNNQMFFLRWRRRPAHPATARGLIRDSAGRWLIVQPVDGKHWQLPGGRIEQNEPPSVACRRELHEELGVDLDPGPLHAMAWRPARRRPARFTFIFDMGTHDSPQIRLQLSELKAWQWATPEEALKLLKPEVAMALTTAEAGPPTTVYLEL